MLLPARSLLDRVEGWLPHGAALTDDDWRWRHNAVCLVLGAHVPVLAVWALVGGHGNDSWLVAGPLLVLLVGARQRRLSRSRRSLSAAVGVLACSAAVVHLSGDRVEGHFHFFVAVAVIALYQDWAVYALAVGFVLLHHSVVVLADDGHGSVQSWGEAGVHAAAVGSLSAVLLLFWRANELSRAAADRARAVADRAQADLSDGRRSVQAQLEDAEKMRYDLIGTVSHEFRTPLTVIKGAALTLLQRGERVPTERARELLAGILQQQERLSRLLENMLLAAEATVVDESASTDVEEVAAEVAASFADTVVTVLVEPGLRAHIDRQALQQVLANLVDNARHHGAQGGQPLVAGGQDADGVWLRVSNEGGGLDLAAKERLFKPFTQVDSGVTRAREGLGVGLYVVKRLVEVYGGSVDVDSHSGWVTVEVRLRPGVVPLAPPAATRPSSLRAG